MDARIASLVSELDALRTELRELSEANRGSTASLVRRDPSSQGPWPEAWFVEHPGDVSSRLLRAGDRLAELSRNLARVEEAVRRAREARALPGAPGNSLSGDEPGSAAASQDGMPLLPLPGARLSPAARRTPGAPPSGTPSRRKHARRRKTHGEPRASGKIGPGAIPNLLVPPREPFRSPVTTFLRSNRTEGFDIQTLNALPLSTLVERTRGDRAVIDAIAGQADELMARVKHDIDDPESAAALLRDQVRYWLRESAKDPAWTARMPDRWAGLFADSREHGGRLRRWLGDRLWTLRQEAVRGGSLGARLRRSLGGRGAKMKVVVRDAPEEIRGEVAQAILDDLSTHPHDPAAPLPLIALSELAQRRQVVTVNDALGQLFSAPDGGSFVILHPNRYPDCPEVVIRPPSPRAKGAALAYTMGLLRPPAAPAAGTPSVLGPAISATAASAGPSVDPGADAETVWEAPIVPPAAWRSIVESVRASRGRLAPPPADFRSRPAYAALVELLFDDPEFRGAFRGVGWRARPAGPLLLASLLEEGTLVPSVSTDHEYIEAELAELVRAHRATASSEGRWTVRGWEIREEGSHQDGFRFRAVRAA